MSDLAGLVERLEKAPEGSRELDAEIFRVAFGAEVWSYNDNAHIDAQIANANWKGRREAHPDFEASFDQAITWRYRRDCDYGEVPRLTSSIDAAMKLVPRGSVWTLEKGAAWVRLLEGDEVVEFQGHGAPGFVITTASALCIAALKARSPQP